MDIQIIDKLLTIPKDPKELTLKLKRVEGFWQAHLRTVGENGLNSVDELLRNLFHSKDSNLVPRASVAFPQKASRPADIISCDAVHLKQEHKWP